jgi:hypothetical protein
MRFFFDLADGDDFTRDDIGGEYRTADQARVQAIITLTEMARDWLPTDGPNRDLAIQVRAGETPFIEVSFRFEVRDLACGGIGSDKVLPNDHIRLSHPAFAPK